MDPLLITTKVDLSGVNQLATGTESAMARVVAAQLRVKAETVALKDAYAQLGPAATLGNSSATAAIAEHEAALVAASGALKAAKSAVDDLNASEERETATLGANVSARQSATASISLAEGRMMGANRAAGAFLATTLGLGPALQAAFPVIGAIALVEVLLHVGSAIRDAAEALVGWDKASKQAYAEVEKANERAIAQQLALKIGATELGVVGKEGASRAAAEVEKWSEQEKILQEAIANTAKSLGTVRSQIEELNAREKPPAPAQAMGALGTVLNAPYNLAQKALPPPADIPATENLDTLTKKQEQLNQLIEKYHDELEGIQKIHKPGAEALVPLAEAKQAEELGAAIIEARTKSDTANVALAEATSKHLLEIGKITATQEAFDFGEAEQKKIDIRIHALQQLDALKEKSPTYSIDASAQADVTKNQGEITALQVQRQQIAIESADKVEKAEVEAQIKSVDAQIEAARRGSQEKIDLTQQEVDIAVVAYGKQGSAYDAAVAKNIEATKELAAERQRLLDESVRASTQQATAEEKSSLDSIKSQQETSATQGDITRQRISLQSTTGGVSSKTIYSEQTAALASETAKQIALVNQAADVEINAQQKIRDAHLAAASQDTSAEQQQKDIDAATEASNRIVEIQSQTQTQITSIQDKAAKEREQLWEQEVKEEMKAINDFVSQGTNAFNNFLITITTTKGRGNEFRFISEEWQKLLFGMEKDFLNFILKTVENTALFKSITGGLQKALSGVFSKIGLGAAPAAPDAASSAASSAASAASKTANDARQAASQTALSTSFTALTTSITSSTTSFTAMLASLTALNASFTALTATVAAVTLAESTDATTEAIKTAAEVADTVGEAAHTPVVLADTVATIIHTAAMGFDEGGYVPRTGMAVLHEGERVATPDMWDEIGRMGEGGENGDDSGGSHTFNIHHHTNVSALDGADVGRVLKRNSSKVGGEIMRSIKRGSLRLPR
jgi:trimeric autotransporter adhesin